ncbi:hypothetical protein E4634_16635 [Mangrovimicrobium sediminis]|uniref:Uncharacterized protein n=1 Tax=Mangrovimicrobium sediminis TaxID=2562682 RepID=A0A4Z0LWR7_9GAMM|nr:hypothetical protein [Haliea sp. SAOS-164]TGD71741.1 hypothetical protein E4634_16635 [Haliea sp. SAOS-164]
MKDIDRYTHQPLPPAAQPLQVSAPVLVIAPWLRDIASLVHRARCESTAVVVVDGPTLPDCVAELEDVSVTSRASLLATVRSEGCLAPDTAYLVFPEGYPTTLRAGVEVDCAGQPYVFSALPLYLCTRFRPRTVRVTRRGERMQWEELPVGLDVLAVQQWIYRDHGCALLKIAEDEPARDHLRRRSRQCTAQFDLQQLLRLEAALHLLRANEGRSGGDWRAIQDLKSRLGRACQ